jgi:hypothetical protein
MVFLIPVPDIAAALEPVLHNGNRSEEIILSGKEARP